MHEILVSVGGLVEINGRDLLAFVVLYLDIGTVIQGLEPLGVSPIHPSLDHIPEQIESELPPRLPH